MTICDNACRANIFCCLAIAAVTLLVCLEISWKRKATSSINASKKIGYSDKYLNTAKNVQVQQGLICTGDAFIGSDEAADTIRQNFPSVCAVEMEGVAIAQSCHLLGTPFLVIRSLSDIAGKTSTVSFEAYLDQAAKNSATLVLKTITKLV
jgi:adenosylhomocysteine nucleosidase